MKYSIEELQALLDSDLNALAAKLRGWTRSQTVQWWKYDNGNKAACFTYNDHEGAIMPESDWLPATDRNQSGELLRYASTQGVKIDVCFRPNCEYVTLWARIVGLLETIQGSDARAETVAFCAAMLAMKDQ